MQNQRWLMPGRRNVEDPPVPPSWLAPRSRSSKTFTFQHGARKLMMSGGVVESHGQAPRFDGQKHEQAPRS